MRKSLGRVAAPLLFAALVLTAVPAVARKPPPGMPSPALGAEVTYVIAPVTPAEASANHMIRPLAADNSVVYEQNFGGGGTATGLLLGPIGIAANIAGIKSRTEKEAAELAGKLPFSALDLLQEAASEQSFPLASHSVSDAITLTPMISVASLDGEQVGIGVMLLVRNNPAQPKWVGRYIAEIDTQMPRSAVAAGLTAEQIQPLRAECLAAMKEVLQLFRDDAQGRLTDGAPVTFKNKYLTRRFDFTLQGTTLAEQDGRMTLRMPLSVYAAPVARILREEKH